MSRSLYVEFFTLKTSTSIGYTARSAYEHEFGAPVEVPLVCNKFFPANTELLLYKQIFNPSIIHSVVGLLTSLEFNAFLTAFIPSLLSILGNILTMSRETNFAPSGKPATLISSIMSKKCAVSFILLSNFSVSGAQCFSMKSARFSIAVLHPEVSSLTGIFGLCVLYRVEFFPGFACSLTMNSDHSFDSSPFCSHFLHQLETFSMWLSVGS